MAESHRWTRYIPFIGYHHILMAITSVSIILTSVMLAGCTSESMSAMHLFSISYSPTASTADHVTPKSAGIVNGNISAVFADLAGNARLEVRASYFGLCAKSPAIADRWICSSSSESIAAIVAGAGDSSAKLGRDTTHLGGDPLKLVHMASKFRSDVAFVGLQFISIIFAIVIILCLSTFPSWFEDDSHRFGRIVRSIGSRTVAHVAVFAAFVASMLGLLSSFWQHLSSAATATAYETATYGIVRAQVGAAAAALAWTSVFCQTVVLAGLMVAVLTISTVQNLV